MSFQPLMVNPRQAVRPLVFALLLLSFSAASVSAAYGQFTLTVSSPLPSAVDTGGTPSATLDLQPNGSSDPVTLTCVVTTQIPQPVGLPTCDPSPLTPITPPAMPSLNVTTFSNTSFGLYTFAVTGTSATFTQTVTLNLTVVNLTEDYTLSALPTTLSPVHAGAAATTVVTVQPIGSYSGHQITLACLSVTPVVIAAPVCSFQSSTGQPFVQVTQGVPATATLTITTFGPKPITRLRPHRAFYAVWLLLPGLALVGLGTAGNRGKRLMSLFMLLMVAGGLLLTPACGTTNNTNNPSGQVTPNNSYTFTLTGADELGNGPGNSINCTGGVNCGAATVTLAVN